MRVSSRLGPAWSPGGPAARAPLPSGFGWRVRVNTIVFVDNLTFHRIDGAWLITAKGYHIESVDAAAPR